DRAEELRVAHAEVQRAVTAGRLPRDRAVFALAQCAVAGKSSGGYGALHLGMRHPELFGAIACHSGDMLFEYCYQPDFPKACSVLQEAGGVRTFLEGFEAKPQKGTDEFLAL